MNKRPGISRVTIAPALLPSSTLPSIHTMGQATSQSAPASCPVDHNALKAKASAGTCPIQHDKPAQCPVPHDSAAASSSAPPAQCPIGHEGAETLNPLNQMPTLSQAPAAHQLAALPTDRSTSSIPRDAASRWEYPSPQQFYNALVRKGWETPEEHVEMMVQIHNFLNEQAWSEIVKWEQKENP